MNNSFSYNGIVTVVSMVNSKITSRKRYHNNGTTNLFEAYARAISGETIEKFIPRYIDIGFARSLNAETVSIDDFSSVLQNPLDIILTYVDGTSNTYDPAYEYGSPFSRASTTVTKNLIQDSTPDDLVVKLLTEGGKVLAITKIPGLGTAIRNLGKGIQLILLWDLYVTNDSKEGNK